MGKIRIGESLLDCPRLFQESLLDIFEEVAETDFVEEDEEE